MWGESTVKASNGDKFTVIACTTITADWAGENTIEELEKNGKTWVANEDFDLTVDQPHIQAGLFGDSFESDAYLFDDSDDDEDYEETEEEAQHQADLARHRAREHPMELRGKIMSCHPRCLNCPKDGAGCPECWRHNKAIGNDTAEACKPEWQHACLAHVTFA